MEQVKVHSKALAVVMTMAMALALSLALAPLAFAVDYNENVELYAMGGNGGVKTEEGQYINVAMYFDSSADLSVLDADAVETYLQANVKIAGRWLDGRTAGYERNIYDVRVNSDVHSITFKIGNNAAGMTANYNGRLLIAASANDYPALASLMGADVETLIGTGVAIWDPEGELSADGTTKTFTVDKGALNRGMVHVLVLDGDDVVFTNGSVANVGFTIHAHSFTTQTVDDFASLISSTANSLGTDYTFEAAGSAGEFTVAHGGESVEGVQVYIYDCNYLNEHHAAVGAIYENEYVNP